MQPIMQAKENLLAVIRAALHKTPAPDAGAFPDFALVCKLARRNCVQSMAYLTLKDQKSTLPAEEFARLEKSFQAAVLRETAQQAFLKTLREKFDAAGIDFMLLKGTHVKALYPAAEMRFMVDMDVLVREADVERAQEILLDCGLSLHLDNGKDIIYMRKPFLTVELHRALFQKENDLHAHFLDVWERAVPLGAHEYKMSDEELYVYTLAHLAEHYTTAGSCFRPVMDLYLLEQKTTLDFSALDARFREMGLEAFAKNVRAVWCNVRRRAEKRHAFAHGKLHPFRPSRAVCRRRGRCGAYAQIQSAPAVFCCVPRAFAYAFEVSVSQKSAVFAAGFLVYTAGAIRVYQGQKHRPQTHFAAKRRRKKCCGHGENL